MTNFVGNGKTNLKRILTEKVVANKNKVLICEIVS